MGKNIYCLITCFIGSALLSFVGCTNPEAARGKKDVYPHLETSWESTARERDRPDSHTVAFRRNHGAAASMQGAKCGTCHVGLSGSPLDSCVECHATARPRDHTLRFRGVAHGRASAANPERCATCHEVDVCTTCHSIAPPSHRPLRVFRGRHALLAGRNPRSCVVCHSFESTCIECHALDITPTGR